jgi:hypothetical protein
MDSNWKYTVQARNAYASSRTHDKEEKRRGIDWEGKRRGIEREEAGLGRSRERPPFPSRPSFTSGRRLLQPPARSRVWGWAHGCGFSRASERDFVYSKGYAGFSFHEIPRVRARNLETAGSYVREGCSEFFFVSRPQFCTHSNGGI